MKRTYKYALAAVLSAAIVVPAFAQDNFPDVPDNHWAFEALARLKKDGLLVGYPDGLFRGPRPASRYEMAVAIHATYVHLKNISDSLQQQIDTIKGSIPNNSGELQAMRDAIAALQNQVNGLSGLSTDVANLKKLTDTFQKELQSLGVDVEAIKKDLSDLEKRVEILEKRKPAVDISGDLNLLLSSGNSKDHMFGLNKDGRLEGVNVDKNGNPYTVGGPQDFSVLHEGAFTLAGTNDTGPKWKGTIVVSNMLNNGAGKVGLGNQSTFTGGAGGYNESNSDWYIQDLGVKFDSSIVGLAFNAEVGRVGYKISPYIYQRPDTTSYYDNARWDDGLWRVDGGVIGFNFGSAKLDVFGGKSGSQLSADGIEISPMVLGADLNYTNTSGSGAGIGGVVTNPATASVLANRIQVNRTLGANLNVPLGKAGNVNLAYLFLGQVGGDATFQGSNLNRITVFGGTGDLNVGAIKLEGGYSKSDYYAGSTSTYTDNNDSYYGKISYKAPAWSLFAAYREVATYYAAPGDWGRLGVMRNPVNIKGVQVGGKIGIGSFTLTAGGEFDKGKSNDFAAQTGFNKDTKITKYEVKLGYNLSSNVNVALGYEDNKFEGVVGSDGTLPNATYRWTTLDLGYGLSEAARLLFRYEISDVKNDYQVSNLGTYKGGYLTTQLSLKF